MSAVLSELPHPAPITFALESWLTFKVEAKDLFPLHWAEVALNKDEIQLDVDYDTLDAFAAAGFLHLVVARDNGVVCGYWLGLIKPHLHYKTSLTAYTDVFYMRQESRKDVWAFSRMLSFVEQTLFARGVQKLFIQTKCHKDLSKIFEHRGMTRTEIVYSKILKG